MKRIIAFLLCLCTVFSLAACSSGLAEEAKTNETQELADTANKTEEKSETPKIDYPAVTDKLSWDKINAIPVVKEGMSVEQLRSIALQYFELALTFAWTPDESYTYVITTFDKEVTLPAKTIYGGMPYVTNGLGNLYRIMDFYDPETGIMKVSDINSALHWGNQCSYGCFWAWSRISNSLEYFYTNNMTMVNGCIPVGPYTYDLTKEKFSSTDPTTDVCADNGEQVMFESYAKLQPADGIVYYTTAGHVRMISSEPVVARNGDGTINGEESYVTYFDQAASWHTMQQSDGTDYRVQGGVHAKVSFASLFKSSYLPFTLKEFLGTDPVENGEAHLSIETGESITAEELKNATVSSNYTISHCIITVTDPDGKELYNYTAYVSNVGENGEQVATFNYPLSKAIFPASLSRHANGKNTISIKAWIGTGQCFEICNTLLTK